MESSPLLGDTSTRSPPPPQGDIYRDAFPSSYSDSETEDEATGLPSSPPRFIDPENRRYQDTLFSTLFLGAFALLVVTGGMSGAIYMALRNSSGLIVGVTAASIGAGTLWILFMSAFVKPIVWATIIAIPVVSLGLFSFILTDSVLGKREDPAYLGSQYNIMIGVAISFLMTAMGSIVYLFKRRRQIDHTIEILQLISFSAILPNSLGKPHHIHPLHHPHAPLHVLRLLWLLAFSHLFLVHPIYPIPMSTRTAVAFFVFMHFWTSAVLQGIEKVTISGVVGQWYFKRNVDETYEVDQTVRNLKAALTTGFGTVCFSALVLASVQTLQAFVKYVRKNSRGSNALLLLIDACLSCTSYTLDTITSMTLLYSGLTGHSLVRSGVLCTRLFRRNLVFGLTTSTLTRVVLTLGSLTAASCVGAITFFYAARGLTSPFAYVVGVVGVVIPFYVLRFISHVLQHTVDATFICYMMDLDTNANNCDGAHRIFEPSLSV
ncbi:plasma-membrane choline transporter-domain-containing protein [Chytridium lagenaria]|nr:plasma-membrane choline transporter-domain-containing protein [Chytridium lagenaria]